MVYPVENLTARSEYPLTLDLIWQPRSSGWAPSSCFVQVNRKLGLGVLRCNIGAYRLTSATLIHAQKAKAVHISPDLAEIRESHIEFRTADNIRQRPRTPNLETGRPVWVTLNRQDQISVFPIIVAAKCYRLVPPIESGPRNLVV